jgi:heme A synthase
VSGSALLWLLPSLLLCCLGLVLGASTVMSDLGAETFGVAMGIAVVFAAAGGLGLVKAIGYYRLVNRELSPDDAED